MRISDWSSDVCSSDLPLWLSHFLTVHGVPEMEQSATHGSDPDPLRITADPALVRAIGGALTVFATLMARKGIESLEEPANLLGTYAVLTDELEPDEARTPGFLAGMLRARAGGISGEETKTG